MVTTDIERQSRYDATKVSISVAVKAVLAIAASILVEGLEWNVNPVALLGLAYFFEIVALAILPEDMWSRIGHRLVPPRNDPPPPRPPSSEPPPSITFPPIAMIAFGLMFATSVACAASIVRDAHTYKQELAFLGKISVVLADTQLGQAEETAKMGDFARCAALAENALVAHHRVPYHVAMALFSAGIGTDPGAAPVVPVAIAWCEEKGMTQ